MWLRRLLRWLAILATVLAVLVVLLVGGFRLWLADQPDEVRSGLESEGAVTPSLAELGEMIWHLLSPPDQTELGGFGRRHVAGRGHAPWVFRSSLDGRPRMLHFALAPEHWVSYATELGSLYQFWRGGLHLSGAVYDTRHGPEPESRGTAFLRGPDRTAWGWLDASGRVAPAVVRPLGHRFSEGGTRAGLRVEVAAGDGPERAIVEETPEVLLQAGRTGLERSFRVEAGGSGARRLVVQVATPNGTLETDAALLEGGLLALEEGTSQLIHWFASPEIAIPARMPSGSAPSGAAALFEANDCRSCHGEHERVVGPADAEIARRYAAEPREAIVETLARKVLDGSVGSWGSIPMPAHPDLSRADARQMVRAMLDAGQTEAPSDGAVVAKDDAGTWAFDVEPRPATLHPSLRLRPLRLAGFTPKVGGLDWLPDGRLGVVTWDPDGSLFAVDGWQEGAAGLSVERLADGLQEPLGLAVVGEEIFVLQKQELTRLVDRDRDGVVDDYQTLSQDWSVTTNFHEFGFGLVHREGWLYGALSVCVRSGGKSCPEQTADRGTAFRVSIADGRFERIAGGLRTPNGVGLLPDGGLLVTDNQGDWLPASKLLLVESGGFYGWRPPTGKAPHRPASPPIVWLPQNEVGNSPTQPIALRRGPYRGQVLLGDVYNGGLKRVALQRVGDSLQGAAFHFTGGLAGGVNRLLESPEGEIVVGEIGSTGNWGETGKGWYGLEVLRFEGGPAFEPLAVEVTASGLDVHFTRALARGAEARLRSTRLQQWHYRPTARYGGPKLGLTDLAVAGVGVSDDRRVAHLAIDGLAPGHVVYVRLDRGLEAQGGEPLWVNEAWVTINAIPPRVVAAETAGEPHR